MNLYTTNIENLESILFYDLPGVNSGLAKLIRETNDMLGVCDAVIIVKKLEDTDFNGEEVMDARQLPLGEIKALPEATDALLKAP